MAARTRAMANREGSLRRRGTLPAEEPAAKPTRRKIRTPQNPTHRPRCALRSKCSIAAGNSSHPSYGETSASSGHAAWYSRVYEGGRPVRSPENRRGKVGRDDCLTKTAGDLTPLSRVARAQLVLSGLIRRWDRTSAFRSSTCTHRPPPPTANTSFWPGYIQR